MFIVDSDMSIHITRGDVGVIDISANKNENELYIFKAGDVVRFKLYPKKEHENVVLVKDALVESDTATVAIRLDQADTKLGTIINKPTVYWYEVELNPDTAPQTIIGYDINGPKLFTLYPEGGDLVERT
jgi:hypothetical protein